MKCTKCGYIVPEDSDFCQFCGARIETQPAVAPVTEPTAPEVSAKEITESQRYFDSDYGYSPENPIVTSSIHMVGYYLRALRTEDGRSFTWERQPNHHGNMIDEYLLFLDGEPYKTVFFNPHGEDRGFIPAGLVRDSDAFSAAQQGVSLEDYQAQLAAKEQKKARRKKRKKRWIIAISIVLILALAGTLLFVLGGPSIKYMYAKHLLRSGDYSGAYSVFYELGSFKDAEEMLLETRYQQAVDFRNAKDFDSANSIFKLLGGYKDSKDLIHYHTYTTTVDVAATCMTPGSATKSCSCGETYTENIPATGHTTKIISTISATCTTSGQMVMQCVDCGEKTTETIKIKSHNYVAKTTKAASCQSAGTRTYTCSECGKSSEETIAKTGHTYTNATCTAAKTCKGCGKTEGSALGHTNTAVCTRCGFTTFKTLTYSGTGSKVIQNISVPKGNFIMSGYAKSTDGRSGSFFVYLNGYHAYWIETLYSNKQSLEKAVSFQGPINGGILEINAGDNVSWTITIKATGK